MSAARPVILKAKPVPIDTFRENVLLLSRCNLALRPGRLAGTRKVEVIAGGRKVLATVIIADGGLVGDDEAGLTQPMLRRLGIGQGSPVEVAPAPPTRGLEAIKAKIGGATLDAGQLGAIVRDLAEHRLSDIEVSAFVVACAGFMTPEETLALTEAMVAVGRRLSWGRAPIVDKHCVGGIPGNRTSLIVTPIVAAHGLIMPKTSSRAITSPAGTADVMEVLARVDLSEDEMREVVNRCGACLTWGGRVSLSPADDVLISVERPLSLDTPEQLVASIMSKKVAAGSTHLLIDIPIGPTAKIRDPAQARRLRKLFEYIAARLGIFVEVLVTDGSRPIGRGVGPVLEARDALAVLDNDPDAPVDLREKALRLAARVLDIDPELPGGKAEARARELLESGAARRKMQEIVEAQGASPLKAELGELVHEVAAPRSGFVGAIDCQRISILARTAGAPTDAGAGIELLKSVGQPVAAGETLFRIWSADRADFGFAVEAAETSSGYGLVAG